MCLLTFYPGGVLPDTEALLNGSYVNNDGFGYAIVTGDRILVRHGLDAEKVIAAFDTDRRANPAGPAMFHSRFATHGDTSAMNCHPFPVGGDPRTVLGHNGVLPAVVQPSRKDPRSDTRILAEDFLPAFGSMRARRNRIRLQKWMTPANKIVILTVDRRFTKQAYLLNEDAGIWDSGIWYSNSGYLEDRWYGRLDDRWYGRGSGWTWGQTDEGWDSRRCMFCGSTRDRLDGQCTTCGGCADCGEEWGDCQCYIPVHSAGWVRR
jgi:hypothetical protein